MARSFPNIADRGARVCLVLSTATGEWTLTMAPGVERFIGRYRRVVELQAASALLRYSSAAETPDADCAGEA